MVSMFRFCFGWKRSYNTHKNSLKVSFLEASEQNKFLHKKTHNQKTHIVVIRHETTMDSHKKEEVTILKYKAHLYGVYT